MKINALKLMIAIIIAMIVSMYAWIYVWHGYSWKEMDWNRDGRTDFGEIMSAIDIGKRNVNEYGVTCVDYYAYKDGLTVKMDCKIDTPINKH